MHRKYEPEFPTDADEEHAEMHFRNRLIWQLPVLLLACAFNATPIGSNATYQFVGQCSDCTGTGTATLVLQNYTLGTQLANANFVSQIGRAHV